MLTQVLVLCLLVVFLLPFGSGLPIVISRYGGRSRRRRERYIMEEKRRVNTCSVARAVNPDIKLGECPNIRNEYKQLYARDSFSYLKNYYKSKCDIPHIKERYLVGELWGALLLITLISLVSLIVVTLIVASVMEIYSRIVKIVVFLTRTNH